MSKWICAFALICTVTSFVGSAAWAVEMVSTLDDQLCFCSLSLEMGYKNIDYRLFGR